MFGNKKDTMDKYRHYSELIPEIAQSKLLVLLRNFHIRLILWNDTALFRDHRSLLVIINNKLIICISY